MSLFNTFSFQKRSGKLVSEGHDAILDFDGRRLGQDGPIDATSLDLAGTVSDENLSPLNERAFIESRLIKSYTSQVSAAIVYDQASFSTTATASSTVNGNTTSSTAVPAWIASLSTGSIKSDLMAADLNGSVTYSGLETLLSDVAGTLSATNSGVTSAEMSDLTKIAANLNNGITTSAYLSFVTGALVNGNAANSTWVGGSSTATSLGNLTVGSSALQLNELIGKWFLGSDLPNSKIKMTGESTFTVSYSTSSSPLFGASGPSINDVNQGELGDCFFLCSLAEVASQNVATIKSMFTANANGTYGVRFYEDGTASYVTVNSQLPDGGTIFNAGTNIWASLAEKAYAQLQGSGVVTGNTVNYGNAWSTIGNGGDSVYALEEITGASQVADYYAAGSSWSSYTVNSSLTQIASSSALATSSLLALLVSDLSKGEDLIVDSNTDATDSSGKQTLVSDHALSIYGYDSATGMLEVRNPWGNEAGQTWDTTFEIGLGTLLGDGDDIVVDNLVHSMPAPSPPSSTLTSGTSPHANDLAGIVHTNDLTDSSTASGTNHFIDDLNFEASFGDLIRAFGTNQPAMQAWYSSYEPIEQRVETFDGLDYVASYDDLIVAFRGAGSEQAVQDTGASHYITNGIKEGRTTTFNGLDYIASYNDLISAFGTNNDAGAFHYIEYGLNEGRTISFDGLDYIASYGDLIKAFGASEQAGAEHYIDYGSHEGRTTTFNGLDYIASYGDLIKAFGANNDAGAAHYINDGINEGRTTTFDGLAYIADYTDLMKTFGANEQAGAIHYIDYGSNEGRSTTFNVSGYLAAHTDLQGVYATNDQFLAAYITTYTTTGHYLT